MSAVKKVLLAVVHIFDLHRAEGWRYIGLATVFCVFADALNLGWVASWVGIFGVVIASRAQEYITARKAPQHVTINMTAAGDAGAIGRALGEHLDRTRGDRRA